MSPSIRFARRARLARFLAAVAVIAATFPAGAQSTDGAVHVNQDSAIAGGVTPGDAPGFPITLFKSGTYRLTGNLQVPAGADGIVVSPGVSVILDLNGFQIIGPAQCSPTSPCIASPGTAGVRTTSDSSSLTVRNGRIRGFSDAGISGRASADVQPTQGDMTVEDMQVWNNRNGIVAYRLLGSRIHAKANALTGIAAEYGMVRSSMAIANAVGFHVRRGHLSDAMATHNAGAGVHGAPTLMQHHVASGDNGNNFWDGVNSNNIAGW